MALPVSLSPLVPVVAFAFLPFPHSLPLLGALSPAGSTWRNTLAGIPKAEGFRGTFWGWHGGREDGDEDGVELLVGKLQQEIKTKVLILRFSPPGFYFYSYSRTSYPGSSATSSFLLSPYKPQGLTRNTSSLPGQNGTLNPSTRLLPQAPPPRHQRPCCSSHRPYAKHVSCDPFAGPTGASPRPPSGRGDRVHQVLHRPGAGCGRRAKRFRARVRDTSDRGITLHRKRMSGGRAFVVVRGRKGGTRLRLTLCRRRKRR